MKNNSVRSYANVSCQLKDANDYLRYANQCLGNSEDDFDIESYTAQNEKEVQALDEIISLEYAYLVMFSCYGVSQNVPEQLNKLRLKLVKQFEIIFQKKYYRHPDFIF